MRGTWQTTSGGGNGGLVLAVVVVVALAASGAASAIASAVVTIAIVLAVVVGLAVLAGIGVLIWRARSDRPRAPIAARPVYQLPPEVRPQLSESHKPALEPARNELHLHFHGMTPAEVAEAIRRQTTKSSNVMGSAANRTAN